MTTQRIGIFCGGLVLLTALPLHSLAACSFDSDRGVRRKHETPFIVKATERMVSASVGIPPSLARAPAHPHPEDQYLRPRHWRWWLAKLRRLPNVLRGPAPYGQIVHIDRIGGPDSLRLRAALERSGGEAVLVTWSIGGDCSTMRSLSPVPRYPQGERFFGTGRLRPDSGWVGDRPTFDAVPGLDKPYHEMPYRDADAPPIPPDSARLSLAEYWTLYHALPDYAALAADTTTALAPLRAWAREHPHLARLPVASWELFSARGYARILNKSPAARRQATEPSSSPPH